MGARRPGSGQHRHAQSRFLCGHLSSSKLANWSSGCGHLKATSIAEFWLWPHSERRTKAAYGTPHQPERSALPERLVGAQLHHDRAEPQRAQYGARSV